MAERVVDGLEIIEVHEQDRDGPAVPRLAFQRVLDTIVEQRSVREGGDGIVERLVLELFLERLALADVANVQHDPVHVGVAEEVRAYELDMEPVCVAMKEAELGQCGPGVVPVAVSARQELEHLGLVLGVDVVGEFGARELLVPVAQHSLHRRADVGNG